MGRSRRHQVITHKLPLAMAMTPALLSSLPLLLGGLLGGRLLSEIYPVLAAQRLSVEAANTVPTHLRTHLLAQATHSTLAPGSTGADVSRLQATLKLLNFYQGEIDGTYSPATQAAVASFQTAAGIEADGITGPVTWQKLLPDPDEVATIPASEAPTATTPAPAAASASPESPSGPPILRLGAEGSAVSQLQRELQTLGYYDGPIDGGFGELTEAAVTAFQTKLQITVDGVVGPSTWDTLSSELEKR